MDHSPPGSNVHGNLQARILEGVDVFFSKGSSQPSDQTHISCIAGRVFTTEPPREDHSVQFSSVTQSYLTLCNPMASSTPGQLKGKTITHVIIERPLVWFPRVPDSTLLLVLGIWSRHLTFSCLLTFVKDKTGLDLIIFKSPSEFLEFSHLHFTGSLHRYFGGTCAYSGSTLVVRVSPSFVVGDPLPVKLASFLCVSSLFESAGAHLIQYSFIEAEHELLSFFVWLNYPSEVHIISLASQIHLLLFHI